MPALAVIKPTKQSKSDILYNVINGRLTETSNLLQLVAWLALPEVCEFLEVEPGGMHPWWKYESFTARFEKLPLTEALDLFEPLIKIARWIEDRCSDAWETEAFIDLLLLIIPEKEQAFRQMIQYEIKSRESSLSATEVADQLVFWLALLKRICL